MSQKTTKSQWLLYAIASGACAALNGAFAKLTTTHLTSSWATGLSRLFGMEDGSKWMELAVRGVRANRPFAPNIYPGCNCT